MIDVTFSKQWIHFLRSDRWPPTSTILKIELEIWFDSIVTNLQALHLRMYLEDKWQKLFSFLIWNTVAQKDAFER